MTGLIVVLLIIGGVIALVVLYSRGGDERSHDAENKRLRINRIRFLLDEMEWSDKWANLPIVEKARIIQLYESELADLTGQTTATPEARTVGTSEPAPAQVTAGPKDWSWLAEQQANVFLFAGAFLIVVAALIYVGYSGESLSGALKLSLLAAYTVSFLAAGVVCLRSPNVRTAGQVFLGISSVLVPLNFVLAGSIISDADVSRETMWLAGSLATAAFYTAIAAVGLGRQYAMASGAALISAATAVIGVAELEPEWSPIPYLLLCLAAAAGWTFLPAAYRVRLGSTWLWQAHALVPIVGLIVLAAAPAVTDPGDVSTRWSVLPVAGLALAFYLIEASRQKRGAITGAALALAGLCAAVVYGSELGEEYHSLAAIATGAIVVATVRWLVPQIPARHVNESAVSDGVILSHLAIACGIAFAVFTAVQGERGVEAYAPTSSWFLLGAVAAAGGAYVLHLRMSEARWPGVDDVAAFGVAASLAGLAPAVVYGADWSREYYGVALAASGLAMALGGRVWNPAWLDSATRDFVAIIAVTLAWVPFEVIYEDHLRVAAGVHLAAALFYAGAAISTPRDAAIARAAIGPRDVPLRVSAAWLYASALTLVIGYVDLLRALPGEDDPDANRLAIPLMGLALAFVAAHVLLRRLRPDLSDHAYVISLLIAVGSCALAGDAAVLGGVLTAYAVAYGIVSAWSDRPLLLSPSVVFAVAAVIAWREYLDWPLYAIPIACSTIAIIAYAGGYAIQREVARWSLALRATGATFALVAPAVGFAVLAADVDNARASGEPFETSALYQWSTLAIGVVALLVLVECSIARRGWMLVGASAVMLVAVLLQIGRFQPDDVQAYTAVIGTYLVLLALAGLSRYRLIPELEDTAIYVEAIGAATIMFPSFLQSIDGGWRYELVLLVEAAGFLTAGIAFRRRGLLGTALVALVLVAGRVLLDAINAVPNWIVALIIGMALLILGLAITISRDRWDKWQQSVISWWGDTRGVPPRAPGARP